MGGFGLCSRFAKSDPTHGQSEKKIKVSPPEKVASPSLFLLFFSPLLPFLIYLTHFCESVNMKTSTARHCYYPPSGQHIVKGEGCSGQAVEI